MERQGWKDSLMGKGTYCSYRGSEFDFQHPCGGSQFSLGSVTQIQAILNPLWAASTSVQAKQSHTWDKIIIKLEICLTWLKHTLYRYTHWPLDDVPLICTTLTCLCVSEKGNR